MFVLVIPPVAMWFTVTFKLVFVTHISYEINIWLWPWPLSCSASTGCLTTYHVRVIPWLCITAAPDERIDLQRKLVHVLQTGCKTQRQVKHISIVTITIFTHHACKKWKSINISIGKLKGRDLSSDLDVDLYKLKKLRGLSPRANYTDRATAACRRSDCQLLRIRGCHVVSVTDAYGRILAFLDRSRYFSFK
jgi:hypothetical protein